MRKFDYLNAADNAASFFTVVRFLGTAQEIWQIIGYRMH